MTDNHNLNPLLTQLLSQSAALAEGHKDILRRLSNLEEQQRQIIDQQARWKGAVPVLIAVGSVIGFVLSKWDSIVHTFRDSH